MRQVLQPFFALASALRAAGFAVAPDQTQGFVAAVGLLGPDGLEDVRSAALALFAIPPERRAEFDAIFDAIFAGREVMADAEGDDDEVDAVEPDDSSLEVEIEEAEEPTGEEATAAERLAARGVAGGEDAALAVFARQADARLPRRLSYRRKSVKRGDRIDLRRALKEAARRDGEVMRLPETRRKQRQRKIVLLIDVSGSMKERSDAHLRFAHTLVQSAERAEVFTLGTRLTRMTQTLAPVDQTRALARAGAALADLDGGTRLGEALSAFLAVPRYAGFARGALVAVLSDGLERGNPALMVEATRRLSRLAWRLHWLTPLAADPAYRPATAAMAGILPWLDDLSDGSTLGTISHQLLTAARAA
ncbi:vWA domain-containing protein [Pseudaestuariivita sp.]|uniref:vWA domain-containing protein n=1 Tax=Pseudaestuariivita sp. TaxID=2211669 RepID=UPI00405951CE